MYYYVYKIINIETKEYYIGKRISKKIPINDTYMGSGDWIKSKAIIYSKLNKTIHTVYRKHLPQTYIKIILETTTDYDSLSDLEDFYVSDLWYTDPLCKNKCWGGGNIRYNDPKEYHFYDIKNGIDFYCNKMQLKEKYDMESTNITKLINEKIQYLNGVCLYHNKDIIRRDCGIKHHLYDTIKQKDFFSTQRELVKLYNINANSASRLINEKIKSTKGIILYKNKI